MTRPPLRGTAWVLLLLALAAFLTGAAKGHPPLLVTGLLLAATAIALLNPSRSQD